MLFFMYNSFIFLLMVIIVIIRRCVFWCVERKKFNCVGAGALIPSATGISVIQQFFVPAFGMHIYENPKKSKKIYQIMLWEI